MKNGFFSEQFQDAEGNPTGGCTSGRGFTISWQFGPLGRGNERKEPNGAFVEDVIGAAIDRIEFYQKSKWACEENAAALLCLQTAAKHLDDRTKDRERRAVEGTHAK